MNLYETIINSLRGANLTRLPFHRILMSSEVATHLRGRKASDVRP
jgi:hypothetical protein